MRRTVAHGDSGSCGGRRRGGRRSRGVAILFRRRGGGDDGPRGRAGDRAGATPRPLSKLSAGVRAHHAARAVPRVSTNRDRPAERGGRDRSARERAPTPAIGSPALDPVVAEAEVSAYFTPREWWRLGGDGIVREIQRVYVNFVSAIDAGARRARRLDLPALEPDIAGMLSRRELRLPARGARD